jgi:flagellar protein FliO/FliZ
MDAPMLSNPWTAMLAFVAVMALIPLALWALKRTSLAHAGHGPMRLLASLPLGPGQRVVTLEVDDGVERRWLVVGLSASGMSVLSTLHPNAPLAVTPERPAQAGMPTPTPDERDERLVPSRGARMAPWLGVHVAPPAAMPTVRVGRFASLLAQMPRMQRAQAPRTSSPQAAADSLLSQDLLARHAPTRTMDATTRHEH